MQLYYIWQVAANKQYTLIEQSLPNRAHFDTICKYTLMKQSY